MEKSKTKKKGTVKKASPKRKEIRIVDPSPKVLDTVTKLSQKEKRTIGKQAEYMKRNILN